MKRLLLLLILLTFTFQVFSQLHISTNLRKDYVWNNDSQEFVLISTDADQLTFFDFNKDFTTFKHTTPGIASAYIINSSKHDTEEGRDQYELEVVSDVGNHYTMYIDLKNENVRFFYTKEGSSYLVRHEIKRYWFGDN